MKEILVWMAAVALVGCMAEGDTIVLGNCQRNEDCGDGWLCMLRADGTRECREVCTRSAQCPGTLACVEGTCESYSTACTLHAECAEGFYCSDQLLTCIKYPQGGSTCTDGVRGDGGGDEESDVDCGGACSPCSAGHACFDDEDCESLHCLDAVCQEAACDDGVRNQGESDLDCGGEHCAGCANGARCIANEDCAGLGDTCAEGLCNHCGDGVQRGAEECDDGNLATEPCQYGELACGVCGPLCARVPGVISYCGDNVVDVEHGELCDSGAANDDDYASAKHCKADCSAWAPYCGDGDVQKSEQCDAAGDSELCDADCTTRECGDSYTNLTAGEDCDPPDPGRCTTACVLPPQIVTESPLPFAEVGASYGPATLEARFGRPPYVWSLAASSPAMPLGLALSPQGVIEGTPTGVAGAGDARTVQVQVTDSFGVVAKQDLLLEVYPIDLQGDSSDLCFGRDVVIRDGTVLVAALGASGEPVGYLFRQDGERWVRAKRLVGDASPANTTTRLAAALAGETVVIGNPRDASAGTNAGAVYVYDRDAGGPENWGLTKKLTRSPAGQYFGASVAIHGQTLVVGEAGSDTTYVFERYPGPSSTWALAGSVPVGWYRPIAVDEATITVGWSIVARNESGQWQQEQDLGQPWEDDPYWELGFDNASSGGILAVQRSNTHESGCIPSLEVLALYTRDPSGAWA